MSQEAFEILIGVLKLVVILLLMVQMVPLLVWVERRGSAFIQNRLGPNRVGPLGLMQLLADAVKFLFKEEFSPPRGHRLMFYAAPAFALLPGALALAALPLAPPVELQAFSLFGHTYGPMTLSFQGFELGIGIVFVLGVSSLGAYALLLAGWGSANKYSLMGSLRASAQMISYELALGLSLVGILLIYGTFHFGEMIAFQQGPLTLTFFREEYVIPFLPNWGIFYQPLGALIFFAAAFAESNRLPFDLPEAEGELVAGYHTEYGGFKMLMFYIGEYGHMLVASLLMVIFFFGGYSIPGLTQDGVTSWWYSLLGSHNAASLLTLLIFHLSLLSKTLFFLWVFVWVRWSLPRFRYDQLMDLGWKTMLPWALANTFATAVWIVLMRI